MKLTYFISPYDLLDLKTKSSVPLTIDGKLGDQKSFVFKRLIVFHSF